MPSYFEAKQGHCPACPRSTFQTAKGFNRHLDRNSGQTLCGALYRQWCLSHPALQQAPESPSLAADSEDDMDYFEAFIPPSVNLSHSPTPAPEDDEDRNPHDSDDGEDDTFEDLQDYWEPELEPEPEPEYEDPRTEAPHHTSTDPFFQPSISSAERKTAEERAGYGPTVSVSYSVRYPASNAGCPQSQTTSAAQEDGAPRNLYKPFVSQMDWEVAKWAKLRGSGSTAFSELLAIDGVSSLS